MSWQDEKKIIFCDESSAHSRFCKPRIRHIYTFHMYHINIPKNKYHITFICKCETIVFKTTLK